MHWTTQGGKYGFLCFSCWRNRWIAGHRLKCGRSIRSLYFLPSGFMSALTIPCCTSQYSSIPTVVSFPSTQVLGRSHPPVLSPDSPACTSCESPDYAGCHGDTHHPSLPILLQVWGCCSSHFSRGGWGLWVRLGSTSAPALWVCLSPSGSGPRQGAASSGFQNTLCFWSMKNLLKDYFE